MNDDVLSMEDLGLMLYDIDKSYKELITAREEVNYKLFYSSRLVQSGASRESYDMEGLGQMLTNFFEKMFAFFKKIGLYIKKFFAKFAKASPKNFVPAIQYYKKNPKELEGVNIPDRIKDFLFGEGVGIIDNLCKEINSKRGPILTELSNMNKTASDVNKLVKEVVHVLYQSKSDRNHTGGHLSRAKELTDAMRKSTHAIKLVNEKILNPGIEKITAKNETTGNKLKISELESFAKSGEAFLRFSNELTYIEKIFDMNTDLLREIAEKKFEIPYTEAGGSEYKEIMGTMTDALNLYVNALKNFIFGYTKVNITVNMHMNDVANFYTSNKKS